MQTKLMNAIDTYAQSLGRVVQVEESGDSDEKIASLHETKRQARDAVQAMLVAAAPQAVQAAVPKWIDDPHDIEQGQMLNPEWVKLQQSDAPAHPAEGVPAHVHSALTDARAVLLSINRGDSHRVKVGDDVCYWQRDEWVQWAINEVLPMVNAAIAATHPTQQGLEPTMFWDADDPERCESSINNVVVEVDNCRGLRVGDIVTIQRAVRLPNLEVRITQCPDAEGNGDLEWDEVVAAQAKQGGVA